MAIGLGILALSLGIAAVAVAIASDVRTRKATRELARELVALRARLGALEREEAPVDADAPVETAASETLASIQARLAELEVLEGRLREALARAPIPISDGGASADDVETRVRLGLAAQGYGPVVVLGVRPDGGVLVEASNRGRVAKGVARVEDDGGVVLEAVSSVRAFP